MATSPAVLLLEAVHFALEADIPSLRKLVASNSETLDPELVLRLLLAYLPESTEPEAYTQFIIDLTENNLSSLDEAELPETPVSQLQEDEVQRKARSIRLQELETKFQGVSEDVGDLLPRFVVSRAHAIDKETGSLLLVQQFVEPFVNRSKAIQVWMATTLLPLLRLEYEYHPQEDQSFSLAGFESLQGSSGLRTLLAEIWKRRNHTEDDKLSEDLRGIIGPWILGETNTRQSMSQHQPDVSPTPEARLDYDTASLWSVLFELLLERAQENFTSISTISSQWDGPGDFDLGGWLNLTEQRLPSERTLYAQTVLAMVYLPLDPLPPSVWEHYHQLLGKAGLLADLEEPTDFREVSLGPTGPEIDQELIKATSSVHTNQSELLEAANPLTRPSTSSLNLAQSILASCYLLSTLGESLSPVAALGLCLYGFEADQQTKLQLILNHLSAGKARTDGDWREIRNKLHWIHRWGDSESESNNTRRGLFGRLPRASLELEILKTLIHTSHFNLVSDIYLDGQLSTGLSKDQIRKPLLDVAFSFYDNASNGNKTRGGIKKASEIITTFRPRFSDSVEFTQAYSLIQATHSISFYALMLQHGVPFLPVNIRIHSSPLLLIEKILDQNHKSYTHLEDLLDIARNLVKAGLIRLPNEHDGTLHTSESDNLRAVERQVIAKAITAALKEEDFDTAYSYIVNRLSSTDGPPNGSSGTAEDTVLWQAAYQAGKYSPPNNKGSTLLRRLEQRMELLSQALLIAPAHFLQQVLATWRECEEEVNELLAQESEEEEQWNAKGDRHLPGGFTSDDVVPTPHKPRNATRRAMDEEAPMGLFEVARGAASAFSKSAFPLGGAGPGARGTTGDGRLMTSQEDGEDYEGLERVRKRDMVSNMATGALKSGIGWVIGARPAEGQ